MLKPFSTPSAPPAQPLLPNINIIGNSQCCRQVYEDALPRIFSRWDADQDGFMTQPDIQPMLEHMATKDVPPESVPVSIPDWLTCGQLVREVWKGCVGGLEGMCGRFGRDVWEVWEESAA